MGIINNIKMKLKARQLLSLVIIVMLGSCEMIQLNQNVKVVRAFRRKLLKNSNGGKNAEKSRKMSDTIKKQITRNSKALALAKGFQAVIYIATIVVVAVAKLVKFIVNILLGRLYRKTKSELVQMMNSDTAHKKSKCIYYKIFTFNVET